MTGIKIGYPTILRVRLDLEALTRRSLAIDCKGGLIAGEQVALGALEGLAHVLEIQSNGSPRAQPNPDLLLSTMTALRRILLGYDAAADRRKQRALRTDMAPTIIQLLGKHCVHTPPRGFRRLAGQALEALRLMGLPDEILNEEVGKFPALSQFLEQFQR